jgi:hypothetical protein
MHAISTTVLLALASMLGSDLGAQTFVVDASGGPGSHFTSLPAAVAAVPDGAVLIVRSGNYQSFALNGRGLTILGEPGAHLVSNVPCTITGVPANRAFAMRGVNGGVGSSPARIDFQSCVGPVFVKDILYNLLVTAHNCTQVALQECNLSGPNVPAAVFSNSAVVATRCWFSNTFAPTTIDMTGGSLQLVRSTVGGGYIGNAITMNGGSVRMGDLCSADVSLPTAFAVTGTGVLRRSPGIVVGPCAAGITITVASQPTIFPSTSTLGGSLSAWLLGPTGDVAALFFGEARPPTQVHGFVDAVGLDPTQSIPLVVLPLHATSSYSTVLPANPLLLGHLFGWQAVVFGPSTGLALTPPSLWTPQ